MGAALVKESEVEPQKTSERLKNIVFCVFITLINHQYVRAILRVRLKGIPSKATQNILLCLDVLSHIILITYQLAPSHQSSQVTFCMRLI